MAIDQYAICPCGSGKKIKFCKCFDSIGEMDKVMKMVQGGQMVAALDRLNQIFKQHPTAAWALAIKGRLLLGMNELPNLEENADRFIRLQPSNPLALAQKAAAQCGQGKLTQAAHSILESLAESGQSVDSLIIEICGILALSLARSGNFLSARMFATIALMASQDEMLQRVPRIVLEELNGSDQVNLLLKTLPTTVPRPASVSWGERFDEAQALLYSNQILASEAKLEALDRQNPGEPAIMMSLFVCAIWRADIDAQARWLAKVSEALAYDEEKSIRLLAISWLLGSKTQALDVPVEALTYDLDDAEQAVLELTAEPLTELLPDADLASAQNEDGIRPRASFGILDRPQPEIQEVTLENAKDVSQLRGLALVFGRQTDKPPQLLIRQIYGFDLADVKELISKVLPSAKLVQASEEDSDGMRAMPLTYALAPRVYLSRNVRQAGVSKEVLDALHQNHLSENVVRFAFPCLEGKSPLDLVSDSATIKQRTAFMRVLQGDMAMVAYQGMVGQLAERLGVAPLGMLTPKNDEELELLPAFDLLRVDIASLDNESLYYYFERSSQAGLSELALVAAQRIVAIEASDEDAMEMIMRAYVSLISGTEDHMQAIEYAKKAKSWCAEKQVPDASVLLTSVPRYLFAMDPQGFSATIQEIQAKYGSNPEVMTHLTRMLIDLGVLNPDGSPRRAPVPAPKSGNTLWTGSGPAAATNPGAASPIAGSPSDSGASGGGSKLWLPGMD